MYTHIDEENESCDNIQEPAWGHEQTLQLLKLRLHRDDDFYKPRTRKREIWIEIAKEFNTKGYIHMEAHQLEKKYNNLKGTYLKNLQRKFEGKSNSITWEYFNMMDRVLGPRESTHLTRVGQYNIEEVTMMDGNEESLIDGNRTCTRIEKFELERQKFEWKKQKVEALEKAELEKIRAIKDLASAIRELAKVKTN